MPIYVYGCNACGAVEEHIQRFSDPPLTECSSCGGRLEKQVTSAAFQLKGGGWYKDLYSSSKPDKSGGSDTGGSSGSSGSSESSGSKDSSPAGSSSSSSSSGSSAAAE
jgi:putative FmdB family regulatory protein